MQTRSAIGVVLTVIFAVGLTACGGESDDSAGSTTTTASESSTTTTSTDVGDKDGPELAELDYAPALVRLETLMADHPDEFPESAFTTVAVSDENTYGAGEVGLQPLCDAEDPTGSVAAGAFVEYKGEPPESFLFNSSVDAFVDGEAEAAFDEARQQVDSCTKGQPDDEGFVSGNAPWEDAVRSDLGDDENVLVLSRQNPETLVTIHDLMIRDGQYVYSLRVVNDESARAALNSDQVTTIMTTGATQFRDWVDALA